MSKAFTKESCGEGVGDLPDLPERPVSPHPNLVTPHGQAMIDGEIGRHSDAHARALAANDRQAAARAAREMRYWTARRNTAQIQPALAAAGVVAFGSHVTILRDDGRRVSFRVVGEDEADPAKGRLSYVSPLARELMGKGIGEHVEAGASGAKIVAISI
jgi:transcription elongation GreA/GreB family factor